MKKSILFLSIGIFSILNVFTQTPYDNFAPEQSIKSMIELPEMQFNITNTNSYSEISRVKFDKNTLSLNLLDKNDNVIKTLVLNPNEKKFLTMDPLAEKYYHISPYAYCANNPLKYIDLRGDSLTLAGSNLQETLTAIYHGLEAGSNITFKFNNGILAPSSIAEQAKNTSDIFLQDIYEIAVNSKMVELSVSEKNTYIMNGKIVSEDFIAPYDYDIKMETPEVQQQLIQFGEIPGKTIQGSLGQTLIPGNVSASGKSSTNNNVQVIINGRGSLNHRSVGIAHEFGHVVLFLRGLPYGHGQSGVDNFIYNQRSNVIMKRLGYAY